MTEILVLKSGTVDVYYSDEPVVKAWEEFYGNACFLEGTKMLLMFEEEYNQFLIFKSNWCVEKHLQ